MEFPEHLIPRGEWKVKQITDAYDVRELMLSDKPCFKIEGPEGITGFYWGWTSPREAVRRWVVDLFGTAASPYPVTIERYFT